jgi:Tetratricopeptide repeat
MSFVLSSSFLLFGRMVGTRKRRAGCGIWPYSDPSSPRLLRSRWSSHSHWCCCCSISGRSREWTRLVKTGRHGRGWTTALIVLSFATHRQIGYWQSSERIWGKFVEAITNLSRSVELQPTARGYLALGNALQQSGRTLEALTAYEQATRIAPSLTEAQQAADSIKQRLSHPTAIF